MANRRELSYVLKCNFHLLANSLRSHQDHFEFIDKTCEPGYYLDLKGDHECHKCNPGTYSLGSGAKITYWPESDSEGAAAALPLGFVIDNTYISYTSSSCNMYV